MNSASANSDTLAIVLWGAMILVLVVIIALERWAKQMGTRSRVGFWDVKRMRNRYESRSLNLIALFLSLVLVPISAVIFLVAFWRLLSDGANSSDVLVPIAFLISSPREYFMLLCDLFAEPAPAEV